MNELEIMEEYGNRSRSARTYREIAALLLVISIILLALYGINQARMGIWGGVLLAAGIVLMVACFALALLSFINLRCPNCGRVLGEVHDVAFCPSCGVALKSGAAFGMESLPEEETGGRGAGKLARRQEAARRAVGRAWEPRSGQPGINTYPGEAYPKNIRMFTTKDEMELTKRYIHLIDKDNSEKSAAAAGGSPVFLSKNSQGVVFDKTPDNDFESGGSRPHRGILGSISLETKMALIAGSIVVGIILIMLITSLK